MKLAAIHILLTSFIILSSCDSSGDGAGNNDSVNNLNNTSNTNNTSSTNNLNNQNNQNNPVVNPAWFEPDPEGRVTQNNLLGFAPEMVVVTSAALAEAWGTYAAMRTTTGMRTSVVTMDTITDAQEGRDDAEKLRNYLVGLRDDGVRFVLLGGDREHVPFRRVENNIFIDTQYTANGPSQIYFSNLEADFDADGDGIYGEAGDDLSLEELRLTSLAVGRVPSGDPQEVYNYMNKFITYQSGILGRTTHSLLLSDVATTIPLIGDIDGAEGVEMTYDAFFPSEFRSHVTKHYATALACDSYGATEATPQAIKTSMESGFPMVFHNGHGSHGWFTDILNTAFLEGLNNESPMVFASCACLAGNFADVATSNLYEDWSEQGPGEDSAGEVFINGEFGGVAYVGNTASGLGALGGSQFLHSFYDAIFAQSITRLGEAFNYGHANMNDSGWEMPIIPFDMTDDSEWWTHHVVILLGDPSLPIHTTERYPLKITAPQSYSAGYTELQVVVTDHQGTPVQGALVSILKDGDFYLEATSDSEGVATFAFMPYEPRNIEVGAVKEGSLPGSATIIASLYE